MQRKESTSDITQYKKPNSHSGILLAKLTLILSAVYDLEEARKLIDLNSIQKVAKRLMI